MLEHLFPEGSHMLHGIDQWQLRGIEPRKPETDDPDEVN